MSLDNPPKVTPENETDDSPATRDTITPEEEDMVKEYIPPNTTPPSESKQPEDTPPQ